MKTPRVRSPEGLKGEVLKDPSWRNVARAWQMDGNVPGCQENKKTGLNQPCLLWVLVGPYIHISEWYTWKQGILEDQKANMIRSQYA